MASKSKKARQQLNEVMESAVVSHSISYMAKAITVEAFRNGPVEDMHAEGKLSDEDMKILNKYMVNKIARLMYLYETGDFTAMEILLSWAAACASEWDEPEIDMEEIAELKKGLCPETVLQLLKDRNMFGLSNN